MYNFIYLLIFGCIGTSLLCENFSSCSSRGLLFIVMCGLHTAVASFVGGQELQGAWALAVVAHGLSCSMAKGICLDQGWNPCLLHRQADFHLLSHQQSPTTSTFCPLSPRVFENSFLYLEHPSPQNSLHLLELLFRVVAWISHPPEIFPWPTHHAIANLGLTQVSFLAPGDSSTRVLWHLHIYYYYYYYFYYYEAMLFGTVKFCEVRACLCITQT